MFYRDFSKVFLSEKDHVDQALTPDLVHPDEADYCARTTTMEPFIKKYSGE